MAYVIATSFAQKTRIATAFEAAGFAPIIVSHSPNGQNVITEAERLLIIEALDKLDAVSPISQEERDTTIEGFELATLSEMLKELPEVEAEDPGTIHGLCL